MRWSVGWETLLWSIVVAMASVALFLAWGQPIDRSTGGGSPFAEMSVLRSKGAVEAPDFSLPALVGPPVILSALRGQVVFLNFWATWCPPCREEMPSIERLHREFKDKGVAKDADRHGCCGHEPGADAPGGAQAVKDPVCGMDVVPGDAAGGSAEHAGTTWTT